MASTLTKLSASPNRLKYTFSSDGSPSTTVQVSAATLIADCAAGPLKAALDAANKQGASVWAALPLGATVSFYAVPTSGSGQLLFLAWGTINGGLNGFAISGSAAALSVLVEIAFNPSQVR